MPLIDPEPSPGAWLAERLPRRFAEYASDPDTGPWYTVDDLLAGDAALLRRWHTRLVDDGVRPAAAATYLAGWIGGALAGAVGHALATVDAGFLVEDTVRWHQHPDGWIDRVELGRPGVVVSADHPWRAEPGVTIADRRDIGRVAVERLVATLGPVIDACHDLGRTGRAGLWNEVADGLGLSVAHQPEVPVHPGIVEALARAVRTPGAPWRSAPSLRIVEAAAGPTFVGQKGGCCLAYTCTTSGDGHEEFDEAEVDHEHRAYLERFPEQPGAPRYCSTCKFRDPADSERRQLFWIDREHMA